MWRTLSSVPRPHSWGRVAVRSQDCERGTQKCVRHTLSNNLQNGVRQQSYLIAMRVPPHPLRASQ
jgi:hypothetical protein